MCIRDRVFEAMQQQGVVPNAVTCSAVMSAQDKGEQPERALQFFDMMKKSAILADVIIYNTLITATATAIACKKSMQPTATTCKKSMQPQPRPQPQPQPAASVETALKLLKTM